MTLNYKISLKGLSNRSVSYLFVIGMLLMLFHPVVKFELDYGSDDCENNHSCEVAIENRVDVYNNTSLNLVDKLESWGETSGEG